MRWGQAGGVAQAASLRGVRFSLGASRRCGASCQLASGVLQLEGKLPACPTFMRGGVSAQLAADESRRLGGTPFTLGRDCPNSSPS